MKHDTDHPAAPRRRRFSEGIEWTCAPSLASSVAVARPMPAEVPVTITTIVEREVHHAAPRRPRPTSAEASRQRAALAASAIAAADST
jgi:hypothetical protein